MSSNLNNNGAVGTIDIGCETCLHKQICKHKEQYQKIVEEFDDVMKKNNVNFANILCNYFSYDFINNKLIVNSDYRSDLTISRAPEDKEIKYTLS